MATESVATPSLEPTPAPSTPAYVSNPVGLIKPTFETFKRVFVPLLAIAGIVVGGISAAAILGFILYFVSGDARNAVAIIYGVVALFALLYLALYTSWMTTVVMLEGARGQKVSLRASRPSSFGQLMGFFGTNLLAGIFTILGLLFLIVPGIILSIYFSFLSYVIVEEKLTGMAAIKRSANLVSGRFWEVAGISGLASLINVLSWVPGVGGLLQFVVAIIMGPITVVRYVTLKDLKARDDWRTVKVAVMNYVLVVAGLAFMIADLTLRISQAPDQAGAVEKTVQPY